MSQQVLVIFADPSSTIAELVGQLILEDPQIQRLLYDFQVVAIDSTKAKLNFANQLAAKFGVELGSSDEIQFAATATDGTVVARSKIHRNEFNQKALADFLQSAVPEPIDAKERFSIALKESREQSKKLIVLETATWSESSSRLSQFFRETENTWGDDYLLLEVDQRWHNSQELCEELRGEGDGGLPWYGIVDSEGKALATSNTATGRNIALPLFESGQKHFAETFKSTAGTMTEKEVEQWAQTLNDKLRSKE